MPALFIFLLKVNLALIAFCLGYYLVLRKLTFYTLNRFYLVSGIVFSSFYPFISIDGFMQRHKLESIQQAVVNLKAPAEKLLIYPWYWNWAAFIFWLGAAVFTMRLITQFISLYRIYRRSEPATLQQFEVRVTDADISPFSFWRSIFINPDNIEDSDLKNILQHEQIHVNEWHTLDILLAEVSVIFYWFNPGIWLMKKAVSENIEFITDRKILHQGMDSKAYQYSLLNVSMGVNASPDITSHFNFSTLKKRIRMMNTRRSSNINLTRYAVLVPAVVICLCVFSVTKANIVNSGKLVYRDLSDRVITMIHAPLAEINIKGKQLNKRRKFLVQVIDTAKRPGLPITFQFRNDSISRSHHTFVVKSEPGTEKSYLIDGSSVSADEFEARRPHVKMDTVNVIADYSDKRKAHVNFFVRVPDNADARDDKTTQPVMIDGKPISSIMTVERITLTAPPAKDSIATLNGKKIIAVRLNGKNISKDEMNKLPASILSKVIIADKPPVNNSPHNEDIDFKSIYSVKIDGKVVSKDELDKIPAAMLEKVHVVKIKPLKDGDKDDTSTGFKRTWDLELSTKKATIN